MSRSAVKLYTVIARFWYYVISAGGAATSDAYALDDSEAATISPRPYLQYGTVRDAASERRLACAPGSFHDNATGMCDSCPKGTYSGGGAGAKCMQCPPGKFQDHVGQADCKFYEIVIGIYGPLTSMSMSFLATAVSFDLDFRKNFNSTLVERFGPPIIPIPNLNENLRVKVQIGNSDSKPDVGVSMALSMFQGQDGFDKIKGLVGGYHSGISMPVNNLANLFKVPQIAWGSTNTKLSDKKLYKFFCRTCPPDSVQGACMWEFMKMLSIPSAAFFYSQEPYGEGLFQNVIDASAADGLSSKLSGVGMKYLPAEYDYDEARAKIEVAKAQGTKFVFLAMSGVQGKQFWDVALRDDVGFGATRVQFFGSEALGVGALGLELPPLGYTYFSPINRGPLFTKWKAMWEKMTPADCVSTAARAYYMLDAWKEPNLTEGKAELPTPEMFEDTESSIFLDNTFMFDAAYTFVMAFNQMMNEGIAPADIGGQPLLEQLKSQMFEGISGNVFFDANGDRYASYTIRNIVAKVNNSERRLGMVKQVVVVATFDSSKVGTEEDSIKWASDDGLLWQDGTQGKTPPAAFLDCEPGFSAVKAGDMCTKCHAGSYSFGGSMRCSDCPPGKVTNTGKELGATSCVDCRNGFVAKVPGSTLCDGCPKGNVPNGNSTSCVRCPQGTYQDTVAGTICRECGASQTTRFPGAENVEDCKCMEGYYAPRVDFSVSASCVPCRKGMACLFGSDMAAYYARHKGGISEVQTSFPQLLPGHMSLATNPLSVYACKDEERCPGGNPGTCGPYLDTESISCAHCMPSWYWTGVQCKPCNAFETSVFLFPLLPFFIAPFVIVTMYRLFRDDVAKWGSWRNGIVSVAFIMLNHYQITFLANQANLDIPQRVNDYFSRFAATDDFLLIFKPYCAGYSNFEEATVLRALGPMIGLVIVVLTFLFSHVVKMVTATDTGMEVDRTINVYFSCVFTFFAGISSMALSLFKCHANPNGLHTLVKDESIHCYETRWNSMVIVAIAAVLLYILGFGALFVYIISIGPQSFHKVPFQRRWKFLFIKYRPDVWWWATVLVTRGVVMNVGFVFFELGIQQLSWILSVVLVYGFMVVHYMPWRHRRANSVDVYMLLAILLALGLLSWYAHESIHEEDSERIESDIQISILVVNLSPLLLSGVVAFVIMRSQKDELYKQRYFAKANELRRHMAEISSVSDDDFNVFLMSLDEWSVWHVHKACAVIALEVAGKLTARKGLFPALYLRQKSDESQSCPDFPLLDRSSAAGVGEIDSDVTVQSDAAVVGKPVCGEKANDCDKEVSIGDSTCKTVDDKVDRSRLVKNPFCRQDSCGLLGTIAEDGNSCCSQADARSEGVFRDTDYEMLLAATDGPVITGTVLPTNIHKIGATEYGKPASK